MVSTSGTATRHVSSASHSVWAVRATLRCSRMLLTRPEWLQWQVGGSTYTAHRSTCSTYCTVPFWEGINCRIKSWRRRSESAVFKDLTLLPGSILESACPLICNENDPGLHNKLWIKSLSKSKYKLNFSPMQKMRHINAAFRAESGKTRRGGGGHHLPKRTAETSSSHQSG